MSKKKKSIPRPRRKTIHRPWPTSDGDVTILTLEQAEAASGVMAEAIELAQREQRGCHFGDHQKADRGGVAGWVLTHKLPWGLSMLAARPVCHKCWYGHNYPMAFHVYIECRHMLFEPPIRRRRRDWNTPRLRFVHSAPTAMQSGKYSEAGDRLA